MAAPNPDALVPALPTDILSLILEEFIRKEGHEICYTSRRNELLSLRILSKQMNDLIVPICYRRVTLHYGIISCFSTHIQIESDVSFYDAPKYPLTPEIVHDQMDDQRTVAEHIRTYAQHVSIDEIEYGCAWWVPDILNSLKNLKHITWSYWGPSYDVDPPVQYAVLACPTFRARWPKLGISVENIYSEDAIPFWPLLADVMSCTDTNIEDRNMDTQSTASAMQIKEMLLASPQMEVCDLTFKSRENATVKLWNIKDGEKLPPFKDLNLCLNAWSFSPAEAVEFWDWSRLTHLTLTRVPIIPFLKTVTPNYLSGLHTFETDCYGSENSGKEAGRLLCVLLENTATLKGLAIRCSTEDHLKQCFPAILKHGSILRWLTLRKLQLPESGPDSYAVIPIKKLTALSSACAYLTKLEIDIKLDLIDIVTTGHILTATLASFQTLRELSLHTQMFYPLSTNYHLQVHEYLGVAEDFVSHWIEELTSLKSGVGLDSLSWHFDLKGAHYENGDYMDVGRILAGTALKHAFIRISGRGWASS